MRPGELVHRILKHRAGFPRWVNRAIDWIVDHPPKFLWKSLSPFAKPVRPEDIPPPLAVPGDAIERIVIAPLNYSAQAYHWARALERERSGAWARNFSIEVPGGFDFPTDAEVPMHVHASSQEWQRAQFEEVQRASHVLVEAQRPLFGQLFASFERETSALLGAGLSVAAIAHGTDVRVPSEHALTTPWSVYHETDFYAGREETLALRNRDALRRLGIPLFVSTPDLLQFLPEAHWCPVVVNADEWRVGRPVGNQLKLVVAHAPSVARVKGTDLIEPTLFRLHEEGVLEYRQAKGVKSADMPAFYAETDLVLDQFRIGSYGVAACEAMSVGRVVLGHVTDSVRDEIYKATGSKLPIVEADPSTIEQILRNLSADRSALSEIVRAGQEFVHQVHDGRMSARVLGDYWLDVNHEKARTRQ